MKNKNIISIGALIAFIFLYSEFVIKPYQRKNAAPNAAVVEGSNTASTPLSSTSTAPQGSAIPSTNPLSDTPPQQNSFLSEEKLKSNVVSIGGNTNVSIFPGAAIGHAELGDYKTRDTKTSVVLLKDGLKWSSSDALVQNCLNSLVDIGNHLVFSSQNSPSSSLAYCTRGAKTFTR